MTKTWTRVEDYTDFGALIADERGMLKDIATRNCMFPDCTFGNDGACTFGCPFETDKRSPQ